MITSSQSTGNAILQCEKLLHRLWKSDTDLLPSKQRARTFLQKLTGLKSAARPNS
jgi:hypothetical protein